MRKPTDEEIKKFNGDRKEIKNKILDFYKPNFDNEMLRFVTVNTVMDSLDKDYKILIEQKGGKPLISINANTALLINSVFMLLSSVGDFYENVYKVLALKEVELACGPWFSNSVSIETKTPEEIDVLREMFLKSPEEIQKYKEQLEK